VRAIGVDVGGTFTDLALWDDARGAFAVFKLPSVPHDPAWAFSKDCGHWPPGRAWTPRR